MNDNDDPIVRIRREDFAELQASLQDMVEYADEYMVTEDERLGKYGLERVAVIRADISKAKELLK